MAYSSKLIENAITEVAKLPGIGKKSALRIVLHLLKQETTETSLLAGSLQDLRENIKYCSVCYNISDNEICGICASSKRDESILCVVEDMRDVMAIENTNQYFGKYHVLGGIISPIDGVGPEELTIEALIKRVKENDQVKEIILALPATMEGDTTAFYLTKKLEPFNIKITGIARGVPVGSELEYTDEVTLGRSILNRTSL
ncbi:MAG: recombination mediator RecR [Bacteroidota bacterium]